MHDNYFLRSTCKNSEKIVTDFYNRIIEFDIKVKTLLKM